MTHNKWFIKQNVIFLKSRIPTKVIWESTNQIQLFQCVTGYEWRHTHESYKILPSGISISSWSTGRPDGSWINATALNFSVTCLKRNDAWTFENGPEIPPRYYIIITSLLRNHDVAVTYSLRHCWVIIMSVLCNYYVTVT